MILVLCPTRGRPEQAWELLASFRATRRESSSRLVFVIDDDDAEFRAYHQARDGRWLDSTHSEHTGGMVAALNAAAIDLLEMWPRANIIGFVGDDHRFRTKGWDSIVTAELEAKPGFVYGNDGFWPNGEIPTSIFLSREIIEELGWFGLPPCYHLYIDNAWRVLGEATASIRYRKDMLIEHMHPAAGKAVWDEGHLRVNTPAMYGADGAAFETWYRSPTFLEDVNKVGRAISRASA